MDSSVPTGLEPDEAVARFFLNLCQPTHLAAIASGGAVQGCRAATVDEAVAWACAANRRRSNVYWTVNDVGSFAGAKPAKQDITAARYIHVDIDPPKDGGELNKEAVITRLSDLKANPSLVIDSGGGIQSFWRLAAPTTEMEQVEQLNRSVAAYLGGDHCHNIDRLMRLPGTINWPDARKVARGRHPVLAKLVSCRDDDGFGLAELIDLFGALQPAGERSSRVVRLLSSRDLNRGDMDTLRHLVDQPRGDDRSRWAFALACAMTRQGYAADEIVNVLLNPANAVSAHILDQADPQRAAHRAVRAAQQAVDTAQEQGWDLSEDRIAMAFAESYSDQLRFCHSDGYWYQWTGTRWAKNETKIAFHYARTFARHLSDRAAKFGRLAVARGVEGFAQCDPVLATTIEQWDADAMLLGTPAGVVDLRTGILREAAREDYITKLTSVAPEAGEPELWLRFLGQAAGGDAELVHFLQQAFGYCLTADTREHALFFVYGGGGNGKSVVLNTISGILGDYATTASMDTFVSSRSDRHPADIAMLRGARLVTASETEEGRAWAESRIKQLTGGDRVSARFMRQDFFTFIPQFKLLIVGNHAPVLKNVDDAARRRFRIIPFTHRPQTPDPLLERKLVAEHGRILHWMIQGCLDWQANGLIVPEVVREATDDYFDEQDVFGQWFGERCVTGESCFEAASNLFADWSKFAEEHGESAGSSKQFGGAMRKRGFRSKNLRTSGQLQKTYRGVALLPKSPFEQDR